MPLYDYYCSSCETESEIAQKISDEPLTTCPNCGKETFQRLVSHSSFALRGSGWYADGYGAKADKADASAKANKPEKKAEPSTTMETKTEAKPEPKPEPKPVAKSGDES